MEHKNVFPSESVDRDAFLDKLYQFHRKLGTPIKRIPMLGGRELDLHHLFTKVQSFGGSKVVQDRRLWGEVARSFNLPSSVTSASYAVRQHYIKLLEKYESYLSDPIGNDPFNSPIVLPRPLTPVPVTTVKAPPIVPRKTTNEDGGDSVSVSRLVRSLLSGYPNEVDFAFNVLTILSHQGGVAIHCQPHLLAVMLAHVGVFSDDDPGLESVYHECWHRESSTDFVQFWELTVPEWIFVPLFSAPFTRASYITSLFNPHTLPTDECVETHRVTQLTHILRNLSFSETSAKHLASNTAVHRFLLLTSNNLLPSVKCLALDTLANLAPHITLPPHTPHPPHSPHSPHTPHSSPSPLKAFSSPLKTVSPLKGHRGHTPPTTHTSDLLLGTVYECVHSQDKIEVIRGVETLGELSWHPGNLPHLLTTPTSIYHRIFQLLLLPDALVILCCLDALYNLSFMSREVAQQILLVQKSVQILVGLLVVKTEDLGTGMLSKVKIFERKVVSQANSVQQAVAAANKKSGSSKVISGTPIRTAPTKSLKIGNSTIPTVQSIKLPALSQGQLGTSSLPKVLTSSGQSFIPVLSVQQLQELLKSMPSASRTSTVTMAGGNVRVNVLSTSPAASKSPGGQSSNTPVVSKVTSLSQSAKVMSASTQRSKVNSSNMIESLLVTSGGKPVSQGALGPEQFARLWLSSSYEECAGSYVSPLEMYSSYLKACTELKGQVKMVAMAEFNTLIKKLFPNSLATKITLSGTAVFMVAGLAKKATPTKTTRDTVTVVTNVTKPINVDAIRGPTSTVGQTTSLTSSKTGLASFVQVSSRPISIQTTSKAVNMTTPTLKSGVQRSESRPASPLTVARRALDLHVPEVKSQEPPAIEVKVQASHKTRGKSQGPSVEVKGQISAMDHIKPFTCTPLTNHISREDDTGPPPAKKVCVEGMSVKECAGNESAVNGPMKKVTTPLVNCDPPGQSQTPSSTTSQPDKESTNDTTQTPVPLATPMDYDPPLPQPHSNNSTLSLVTPSQIPDTGIVDGTITSTADKSPPSTRLIKSESTNNQSEKDSSESEKDGSSEVDGLPVAPPTLAPSAPMDCDTPPPEHSPSINMHSRVLNTASQKSESVKHYSNTLTQPSDNCPPPTACDRGETPSLVTGQSVNLECNTGVDRTASSESNPPLSAPSNGAHSHNADSQRSEFAEREHSPVGSMKDGVIPVTSEDRSEPPSLPTIQCNKDRIESAHNMGTKRESSKEVSPSVVPMDYDTPPPERSPSNLGLSPLSIKSSSVDRHSTERDHTPTSLTDRSCDSKGETPSLIVDKESKDSTRTSDTMHRAISPAVSDSMDMITASPTKLSPPLPVAMETDTPLSPSTHPSSTSLTPSHTPSQRSDCGEVDNDQSPVSVTQVNNHPLNASCNEKSEPLISNPQLNLNTEQSECMFVDKISPEPTPPLLVPMETITSLSPSTHPSTKSNAPTGLQRSESKEEGPAPTGSDMLPVIESGSSQHPPSSTTPDINGKSSSPTSDQSEMKCTVPPNKTSSPTNTCSSSDKTNVDSIKTSSPTAPITNHSDRDSTHSPEKSKSPSPTVSTGNGQSDGSDGNSTAETITAVGPPSSTDPTPPPLPTAVDYGMPVDLTTQSSASHEESGIPSPSMDKNPITSTVKLSLPTPQSTTMECDSPVSSHTQGLAASDRSETGSPAVSPSDKNSSAGYPTTSSQPSSTASMSLYTQPSASSSTPSLTATQRPSTTDSQRPGSVDRDCTHTESEHSTTSASGSVKDALSSLDKRSGKMGESNSQLNKDKAMECSPSALDKGLARLVSQVPHTSVNFDPPPSMVAQPLPSVEEEASLLRTDHSRLTPSHSSPTPPPSHGSHSEDRNGSLSRTGSVASSTPTPPPLTPSHGSHSVDPDISLSRAGSVTSSTPTPSPLTPSHRSHSVEEGGLSKRDNVTSLPASTCNTTNPSPQVGVSPMVAATPLSSNPSAPALMQMSPSTSPMSEETGCARVSPLTPRQHRDSVSMATNITTATRLNTITPSTVFPLKTNALVSVTTQHAPIQVLTVPPAVTMVTANSFSTPSHLKPVAVPISTPFVQNTTKTDSIPVKIKSVTDSSPGSVPSKIADEGLSLLASVCDTAESTTTRPICLWSGCASVRLNWAELFHHVVYTHLPKDHTLPLACQWVGCSSSAKRMRPSLLYHIQSHHCSPDLPPSPPNVARTLLKIKQSQPFTEDSESTLTKSVHLTAGLILRNLARALPEAKQRLLPYESQLCQVACSGSEASVAVAECLYLINNTELSWQQ